MKIRLLFLFILVAVCSFSQKGQFGMYLPVDFPDKSVMPKMSPNIGFGFSGGFSPFERTPFFIEMKASWGSYSSKTLEQTYMFEDSSKTTVDVSYRSSLHKYLIGTKIMIGHSYRPIRGFITPQVGVANFKTNIVIYDPEDEDDCQALERKRTQHFAGFVYGGEIGAEVDLSRIFTKMAEENKHKLLLSASYLAGFEMFEYVNIRYMQDEVHDMNVVHDDRDINATFVNVSTNSLHEHKIAELYHTPLRFWGFNLGYVCNF